MEDNRRDSKAAMVREKSEYLKRIDDFVNFMQKEYADWKEDTSLLVSAVDNTIDGGERGCAIHAMMGNRQLVTASIVSMMQNEETKDLFHMARYAVNDDEIAGDISRVRARLRMDYAVMWVWGIWTLLLIVMGITGLLDPVLLATCLFLMAVTCLPMWRSMRPDYRMYKKLKGERKKERSMREAMVKEKLDALYSMLDAFRRQQQDDDDDE